ncbi:nitronate monooxygenase [Salmonella enterica subsp. enterica]|nr:nitronate monooxygenase [Salmonella enterica subsp. enterica serovar Javiana]EEK7951450.1 nitronate monooxygenase [Salmonella enterica subsp. enterica serovar Javiana]EEK7979889.1 nitronate monooxygenase [Salmonella enterica subsp. enterica serovar Javiana]EEK8039844.1 nitronate monooxygenase [Salmonella enterica subsp. enterica serovar Javiana]EEK8072946.1 nitronate monooxygenase [Salmonella enterica subsp. enterica serovar Javiana]
MSDNNVGQILGIEKNVIQGPMSWLTDARLVAAVSNAGGLGVLGPNAGLSVQTATSNPALSAELMREEIRKTKQLTRQPFGINLLPSSGDDIWTPPLLSVIKEEGIPVVVYTGYKTGEVIPGLFDELKSAGVKIIYRAINPSPANTRLAEAAGADIIVATGADEGGILPEKAVGTFSVIPLLADAVKNIPVVAAGGISDRRTAMVAHVLGAQGVFAGSVFISASESRASHAVKMRILDADGLDLNMFRTVGARFRSLPGQLVEKLAAMQEAGATPEELSQVTGGINALYAGMIEGNSDKGYMSLGTGIGLIRDVRSAHDIVHELHIA